MTMPMAGDVQSGGVTAVAHIHEEQTSQKRSGNRQHEEADSLGGHSSPDTGDTEQDETQYSHEETQYQEDARRVGLVQESDSDEPQEENGNSDTCHGDEPGADACQTWHLAIQTGIEPEQPDDGSHQSG